MNLEQAHIRVIGDTISKWCPMMNSSCANNCVNFEVVEDPEVIGLPTSDLHVYGVCQHFKRRITEKVVVKRTKKEGITDAD